jgi:hypothetical protein
MQRVPDGHGHVTVTVVFARLGRPARLMSRPESASPPRRIVTSESTATAEQDAHIGILLTASPSKI